jgi:hypothetical protein
MSKSDFVPKSLSAEEWQTVLIDTQIRGASHFAEQRDLSFARPTEAPGFLYIA